MDVPVGPPVITVYADDEVVVCEPDARMSSTAQHGYFVADTRLVSGYRLRLGRVEPVLLNSSEVEHYSCRFEFTNPDLHTSGGAVPGGTIQLRLDRTVEGGVHEDYDVVNYGTETVGFDLEVSIESDFADVFDVRSGRLVRRGRLQSVWDEKHGALTTRYENGEFCRAVRLQVERAGVPPEFANGNLLFRVTLEQGEAWHTCLHWLPLIDGREPRASERACHDLVGEHERDHARRRWVQGTTRFDTSDPEITAIVRQAVTDLASLRMTVHDDLAGSVGEDEAETWVPAAGVPWFVSLFGRDALTVSLQTLSLSPRFALGSLRALGALQAESFDDDRDMQPGKILHEVRRGELAQLGLVPHRPYYGTHDATALYVWTAAEAWRWHGDRGELDAVRPHVERCLAWIDHEGDPDGDGLQEYATRAREGGYFNQGWKDSGDAIVGADGGRAELPVALCELQGYVVAAKRAWAQVLEDAYEDLVGATRLRGEADRLADLIEECFWWEAEGTYHLGLDGRKRPIASVASNAGHLLWAGAVAPERAASVARRLLADDVWSGWGVRTLSAAHAAYNPYSYQLGSVWPHDNAICAAGFRRYGLDREAARVARAMLDAASMFQARRLPELFAGLYRNGAGFPVQYLGANVPQAWASGAVVHLLATLLGLEADAADGALRLRPALPEWLGRVRLENLRVGDAAVDLEVQRRPDGTPSLDVARRRGALDVELADGGAGLARIA